MNMDKKKQFIINTFYFGLIVILFWAACKYVLPVLIPFIIAFIIASLIRIPVKRFYGKTEVRNRLISVLACIAFYGLMFAILSWAGVNLYHTISEFLMSVPKIYQENIVPALNLVYDIIEQTLATMDEGIAAEFNDIFQEQLNSIGNYITTFSVNAVKAISGSLAGIPAFIIKLIITIISTFFCIIDYNKILILSQQPPLQVVV